MNKIIIQASFLQSFRIYFFPATEHFVTTLPTSRKEKIEQIGYLKKNSLVGACCEVCKKEEGRDQIAKRVNEQIFLLNTEGELISS